MPQTWRDVLMHPDEVVGRDLEFKDAYDPHLYRGPIARVFGIELMGGVIQFELAWTAFKSNARPWTLSFMSVHPAVSLSMPLIEESGALCYRFAGEESGWGKIYPYGANLNFDSLVRQKIILT